MKLWAYSLNTKTGNPEKDKANGIKSKSLLLVEQYVSHEKQLKISKSCYQLVC
jgi:hypothetical protein